MSLSVVCRQSYIYLRRLFCCCCSVVRGIFKISMLRLTYLHTDDTKLVREESHLIHRERRENSKQNYTSRD
jgi:hypothetical protein